MALMEIGQWLITNIGTLKASHDRASYKRFCETELRDLIGHEALLAIIGKVANNNVSILASINCGFPAALLHDAARGSHLASRPLLHLWLRRHEPLFVDDVTMQKHASAFERDEIERYGLGCLAIHGMVDISGAMGSYFSFSGVPPSSADEVLRRVALVVPHLHTALLGIWRSERVAWADQITPKETDLLQYVAAGLSTPEISKSSSRSQATIRNQLHHLMVKLSVNTRTELVSRASELGLLDAGIRTGSSKTT